MTDYIGKLVNEVMAIEAESALEAGTMGYMARAMVQATMPHRKTAELHHVRRNGDFRLTMATLHPEIGLPYGSVPRLMLAWIGAEALKTGEREIVLGDSMSGFLRELGLIPSGGRWGTVTRLKDQSRRLFGCVIACNYLTPGHDAFSDPFGLGDARLWWNPLRPEQPSLFKSTLTLSKPFYDELTNHAVPVDMRVLKALKRSPLALDIYCWLSYRIYTLNRSKSTQTVIPWESLQMQFGSGYSTEPQGRRDFKRAFLRELTKVRTFYSKARVEDTEAGLMLKRAPLHMAQKPPLPTGA